ncbi:MAG: hypothetical protein H6Q73_1999 [Firmicutes bacterium]|nr:hypothetical protein [Bacillota bacterium]
MGGLIFYILIVCSGAYFRKIGIGLVHGAFMLAAGGYIITTVIDKSIYMSKRMFFAYILIGYVTIQFLLLGGEIKTLGVIYFATIYYYLIINFGNYFSAAKIVHCTKHYLNFSIAMLCIETIYRIINPDEAAVAYLAPGADFCNGLFYAYKTNSIMFLDSNFTGLFSVVLFCTCEYLVLLRLGKFRLKRLALIILTFCTFSRAAIAALVVSKLLLVAIKLRKDKIVLQWKRLVVILTILAVGGMYLFTSINDGSLTSKFYILQEASNYFSNADLTTILFGVGQNRSEKVLGIYAHNIFLVLAIEIGIIGLLLFLIFWVQLIFPHKLTLIVFIPFVFAGMSAFTYAMTYLYSAVAIIQLLENKRKNGRWEG